MQSEKEWFLKWMVVKTISVLIRSRYKYVVLPVPNVAVWERRILVKHLG